MRESTNHKPLRVTLNEIVQKPNFETLSKLHYFYTQEYMRNIQLHALVTEMSRSVDICALGDSGKEMPHTLGINERLYNFQEFSAGLIDGVSQEETRRLRMENGCLETYLLVLDRYRNKTIGELKQMGELAQKDELTGLYNRRAFNQNFGKYLELVISGKYAGKCLGVISCDLDHFKGINDKEGHDRGDVVLKEVADILNRTVRTSDYTGPKERWCRDPDVLGATGESAYLIEGGTYRLGGEEITVLVITNSPEEVYQIAERVRNKVESAHIDRKDEHKFVTMSIGASVYNIDGSTQDELMKKADLALYTAKATGRNRVVRANDAKFGNGASN